MGKPWAVMCCGCGRIMGEHGRPLEHTGLISGSFATKEEADDAAKAAGWQTADARGANHRCPDCVEEERREPRRRAGARGAYLYLGEPEN